MLQGRIATRNNQHLLASLLQSLSSMSSSAAASDKQSPHSNLEAAADQLPSLLATELTSKLKDPSLLHAAGLIGGKWLGAWNSATYDVSGAPLLESPTPTCRVCHAHVMCHECWPYVDVQPCSARQVKNPATGKVLAKMPMMRADETRAAIAAAGAVFPQWKRLTAKKRADYLRK